MMFLWIVGVAFAVGLLLPVLYILFFILVIIPMGAGVVLVEKLLELLGFDM